MTYFLVLFFFIGAGFVWTTFKPVLSKKVIQTIETSAKAELDLELKIESLSFSFFPLGVQLKGLGLTGLPEVKGFEISIQGSPEVGVYVRVLELLLGYLRVDTIELSGASFVVNQGTSEQTEAASQSAIDRASLQQRIDDLGKMIEEEAKKLPLNRIRLREVTLHLDTKYRVQIPVLEFRNRFPLLEVSAKSLNIEFQKTEFELSFGIGYNLKSLTLDNLFLRQGESRLEVRSKTQMKNLSSQVFLSGDVDLSSANFLGKSFPHLSLIEKVEGKVKFETNALVSLDRLVSAQFDLEASNLVLPPYSVEQMETKGVYGLETLRFEEMAVKIGGAEIAIKPGAKVALTENAESAFDLILKRFQLPSFLKSLGVSGVPVDLLATGEAKCTSKISPQFDLSCLASIQARDIDVTLDGGDGLNIVSVSDSLTGTGKVGVTSQQVSFEAELSGLGTTGKTQGIVDFQEGFDISFSGEDVDLNKVGEIAELPFSGFAKIKGRTKGDTTYGVLEIQAETKNLELSRYKLGSVAFDLDYKAGLLSFFNISGLFERTRYQGDVVLNFWEKNGRDPISGQLRLPLADLADVSEMLRANVDLPFVLTGAGTGELSFSGPLDFWTLSYALKGVFLRGSLLGESYDRLDVSLGSNEGFVKSQLFQFKKKKGSIDVDFSMNPEMEISLTAKGSDLRAEDFNSVSTLLPSLTGGVDLKASLSGEVKSPKIEAEFKIRDAFFGAESLEDSSVSVVIIDQYLETKFDLLKGQLLGSAGIPLGETLLGNPDLKLSIRAKNFDFAKFVASSDFDSQITGDVELNAGKGSLLLTDFKLNRDGFELKNLKPIQVFQDDRGWWTEAIELRGPSQFLESSPLEFLQEKISGQFKAQLDLSILRLLLPDVESLGGPVSISGKLDGSNKDMKLLGTGEIKNAYFKVPGLVHPFERINSQINFSQSQVVFDSLTANFASGVLAGKGQVQLAKNGVTVSSQFSLADAKLEVPDGFSTEGSGEFALKGESFPYTLTGDFVVNRGLISFEFLGGSGLGATRGQVVRSEYLPESTEDAPQFIALDLNVKTKNPYQLKNSNANGFLDVDLQITGEPNAPRLSGAVKSTGRTQVLFRERLFEVESANAKFDGSREINPSLYLLATTRMQGYDITLILLGTPKEPTFRLESQPPLLQEEIVSLLALGVSNQTLGASPLIDPSLTTAAPTGAASSTGGLANADDGQAASTAVASEVLSQTTRGIGDLLGVNIQVAPDLSQDVTAPRVIVSKEITPRLTATASQTTSANARTDVSVQYQLNQNLSVVGMYQSTNVEEVREGEPSLVQDIFGLDLQYRMEFK